MRVAAAAFCLVLAAGCSAAPDRTAPKLCRVGGSSSLCLEHRASDVRVWGDGFRPGSDIHVDVDGGAGQLVPVAADGTFPAPGRQLEFLPAMAAEVHRLEGRDSQNGIVTYTVTCGVDTSKRPSCGFSQEEGARR